MNKSFFVVLLAVVLLRISSVADGAEWKLYAVDNNGCFFYYDVSSVQTLSEGIKKVWTRNEAIDNQCIFYNTKVRSQYGLPVKKDYESYSHTRILEKIDCSLGKNCVVTLTDYDNEENVLDTATISTESWSAISADSVNDKLYKQICK
jgi:hypothetical protein